ncbi:18542_t:CDS:2, partial [Gigaspora margarita]
MIKHLRQVLEKKYNVYLSRQCISAYLEPYHSYTFVARRYHHPAKVALASIARTEIKPHINKHYCLASVKAARMLAEVYVDDAVIIFQDNKAKVSLDVPAVGRTFKTIQTINEPVLVADHDFLVSSKIKLILSVYLVIDPANSNNSLRLDQLAIFIRPEYFVGTSFLTHMSDLQSIISNQQFAAAILKEDKVKPVWVLLIDGGPDENPKHLKNIIYVYNPVERSMASLSEKLAGIILPINKFGSHLDSQGKVLDENLVYKNFEFAGKSLCDIWKKDDINSKPVTTEYIDQVRQPFAEMGSLISWEWVDQHTQISLFLDQNNGFLSSITKGKDQYYINPIHALQYYDKLKILPYDCCYPSISRELHQRLCYTTCANGPSNAAEDVMYLSPQVAIEWRKVQSDVE